MDALWTFVGLGILGAIAATVRWSQGRIRYPDLGFVSQQWLAEHRHSQAQELHR
jgi:hypothetical protein